MSCTNALPGVPRSWIVPSCCPPVSGTLASFLGLCWILRHAFLLPFLASLEPWTSNSVPGTHPIRCQVLPRFSTALWRREETPGLHIPGMYWHRLASTCWLLQHHPIWWGISTRLAKLFQTFHEIRLRSKPEFSLLRQWWWICMILVLEEIVQVTIAGLTGNVQSWKQCTVALERWHDLFCFWWWSTEQGHLISTDEIRHRRCPLCDSLCHVLVILLLTFLLYHSHSFDHCWISDVSSVKNEKVATIFCEWIAHVFHYSNQSPDFLSKRDLRRLGMLVVLETTICSQCCDLGNWCGIPQWPSPIQVLPPSSEAGLWDCVANQLPRHLLSRPCCFVRVHGRWLSLRMDVLSCARQSLLARTVLLCQGAFHATSSCFT